MTTVSTITRNVAGRSLSAPTRPDAVSCGAKLAAVDAATMPRGSIQPTKVRSSVERSVRAVDTNATRGRTTSTRHATRARVGQSTSRSDAGVTVAEIETNN